MKRKFHINNRLQALPVLFLILFSLAVPLIHSAPASAATENCQNFSQNNTVQKYQECRKRNPAPFNDMTVNEQVQSYLYANALAACMDVMNDGLWSDKGNDVKASDIAEFDIWNGTASEIVSAAVGSVFDVVILGTYMTETSDRAGGIYGVTNGTANNNGQVQCDVTNSDRQTISWVYGAIHNLWKNWYGGGPVGFVCDAGASRDGGRTDRADCREANGKDYNYEGTSSERQAKTLAAVQTKVYGNNSMALTDVQRYLLYHKSFVKACKAEYKGIKAETDQTNPQVAHLPRIKTINDIDASGNIVPTYYQWPNTDSDEITQHLAERISEPKCSAVADKINETAYVTAYSTYMKYLAADPTLPGSGAGATTCTNANEAGTCLNAQDSTLDCGAGSFDWLICTGIQMLQGAAQKLDEFIMDELNVETNTIFAGPNGVAYKTAWNSFRIIAIAILIIAALVMVMSQALGLEVLDAYTIRKILPRLLFAIIGISLSWPLLQFVINFFNVLGYDLRALIYYPFNQIAADQGIGMLAFLGNPLTLLVATGSLFLIYGPAVFTFLLTAFFALVIALFILVLRQVGIIVLVIIAPVAIACYILPNTQKVWKLWVDNFMGLMLMFPIVSALIAAGHAFSAVSRSGGPFQQFVAIVAYFAPYFMLPFAFRVATGVIATIAGFANDRSKGIFDGLKKIRSNAAASNISKMKSGKRFSERNKLTRGFNNASVAAGTGWSGRFGMGERGRQAVDQAHRNAAQNDVMKHPNWTAISENDDALRAMTYNGPAQARAALVQRWGNTAAGRARADRAIAAAQTSVGFGRSQAIAAAQQMSITGTGHDNMADQALTIARASGGNANTAGAIAGFNNYMNKQKGRHDLAPGAGNVAEMSVAAMATLGANPGLAQESAARTVATGAAADNMINAWNSGGLYQLANGKARATEAFTDYWQKEYKAALTTPTTDPDREKKLMAATMARQELQAMLPNASGDNQTAINNSLAEMQRAEEAYRVSAGFHGYTGMNPQTAAQGAAQATHERIIRNAGNAARTYQRPDDATRTS